MPLSLNNRLRLISLIPIAILFSISVYHIYNAILEHKHFVLYAILLTISIFLALLGYILTQEMDKNIVTLESILNRAQQSDYLDIEKIDINLHTSHGTSEAYELLNQIIEQTKQDKIKAIEASKAKSMFLANMSHEIRTPLNGVVGFTELLKDTPLNKEQIEFIEIIQKSSDNLLEIINNILDVSKIESNKIDIENIEFSPMEEFENAVEVYAVRANEKNIHLSYFIDPSLEGRLKGDPTKIKQVIVNLLSNAVKFTNNGGSISINITKYKTYKIGYTKIKFEVSDNGIGVTSEQKSKIFDAFSQADSSITRKYGGTGLGLTISSRFVELMGGKLNLESELGKGTTFYFSLEFRHIPFNEPSTQNFFNKLKALVLYSQTKSKKQDKYLLDYLSYYGVKYSLFENEQQLKELQNKDKYNLIFVDYEYALEEELRNYTNQDQELVLLCKSNMMKKIESMDMDIFKTIYEPLNNSKIKQLLETYLIAEQTAKTTPLQKKQKMKKVATRFNAKILVAEDNAINQKLIKRTLEEIGLKVTIASNGLEVFQKRKDQDFDLIFMDIQMPFLDGLEATGEILEYEHVYKQPHIPIIALTANALKGDREKFLAAGMDEYTTKPLVRTEIMSLLNKYLEESAQEEQEVTITQTYGADILLAKKNSFEAKLYNRIFSTLGYSYEIVDNILNLNALIEEYNYKIILFDKELERLDINTLAQQVQKLNQESGLHTKLIMISSNTQNLSINEKVYLDDIIKNEPNKELLQKILQKHLQG